MRELSTADSLLEMRGISKRFAENTVLKNVSFDVRPGEIYALLGENGAGKSTLMNILFGMPVIRNTGGYGGEILWKGKATEVASPRHAMELGIGMVHQEFMLIPGFTIAENIKLNCEPRKKSVLSKVFGERIELLDRNRMNQDSRVALDRIGMDLDTMVTVEHLPVAYKQFVEIAREIDKKNIQLLVFDEPTAVLTESEAAILLDIMKKLAESGIAIIFITHRLDEVVQVADRVTILRDGEVVATKPVRETDAVSLAQMMVGRSVEQVYNRERPYVWEKMPAVLKLKDFQVDMPGEECRGIDLEVHEGEILGIAGLAGQGKIGVANGIAGIYPSRGYLEIYGKEMSKPSPHELFAQGGAFVSEDRRGRGLLLDSSIESNITISGIVAQHAFLNKAACVELVSEKKARAVAERFVEELNIKCTSISQNTRRLSGGNQQKVCLARALALNPRILLVSEPTRGIDIGAKKLVFDYLTKVNRENNVTIIITSSELAELRSVCDRIAIVNKGKVEGVLPPTAPDSDFGLMMSGAYSKAARTEEPQ